MITDGEKWHYLAVKCLSALFRGIISNKNGDFFCLNCFHLYRTKEELQRHEKVCNNLDFFFYVKMLNEDKKILKNNRREKLLKVPFMLIVDTEYLLKKIHSCQSDPKNSYKGEKS